MPNSGERLDSITRYNNTQNAVRISDFRSNDKVQTSIARYVSAVSAFEGKPFIYKNKRSGGAERAKISIKMDDFCRTTFSFLYGPPDFFGGLSHLYDTGTDGGYVRLFGSDLEALSQNQFDRLFGVWLICDFVAKRLGEEKKSSVDGAEDEFAKLRRRALERKYLVFFAVGEVLAEVAKIRNVDLDTMLRSFAKAKWMGDAGKTSAIEDAFHLGCDMVVQAYQGSAKLPDFVHRNFFRSDETLRDIKGTKASRRAAIGKIATLFGAK